jgi:hypothetical protein
MSSSQPHTSLPDTSAQVFGQHSPAAAKVAFFRSLFRGREDVYPRRYESRKTGKSGYAPACANEWLQGICEKARIKCALCPHDWRGACRAQLLSERAPLSGRR